MANKTERGMPPLAEYWMPPENRLIGADGVGQPTTCLATTFEFDAAFFESELLPRFLGLKFDHTENEPSFVVEREEQLALSNVAVLVDQSRFDPRQSTMRWQQVSVSVPRGILHAKLVLLAWERLVRVLVGSANLTRDGYRRNREIFAALDFYDGEESVPLAVVREALGILRLALGWSKVLPMVQTRTAAAITRVEQQIRSWRRAPADFTPRDAPSRIMGSYTSAGRASACPFGSHGTNRRLGHTAPRHFA